MSCHFGSCTNMVIKTAFIVTFYFIALYGYDVFISSCCFVTSQNITKCLCQIICQLGTQSTHKLITHFQCKQARHEFESAGSFIRECCAPPGGEREHVYYQKWTYYALTCSDFGRPKVDPDLVFSNQMWT